MAASKVGDVVNAAVDALKTSTELSTALGGGFVYTHVPQDTDPPYALVLGGDEVPFAETMVMSSFTSPDSTDGGDSGGRSVDVLVLLVSKYRGTKQVDTLASIVMEVLLRDTTWSDLDGFSMARFVRNALIPPQDFQGEMRFQRQVTVRVDTL